jgi:hypothetical protein
VNDRASLKADVLTRELRERAHANANSSAVCDAAPRAYERRSPLVRSRGRGRLCSFVQRAASSAFAGVRSCYVLLTRTVNPGVALAQRTSDRCVSLTRSALGDRP